MDSAYTGTEASVTMKNDVLFFMKNLHTVTTKRDVINKRDAGSSMRLF